MTLEVSTYPKTPEGSVNLPELRQPNESEAKNRILIRNLSGSDEKINAEVSEGWNPLSPASLDGETDVEHLLSSRLVLLVMAVYQTFHFTQIYYDNKCCSEGLETYKSLCLRCGSHAGSSLRTVDSMTNVTRMTVSSIDFSQSLHNSDSFSSVSSVQSSLSSGSSEDTGEDYHHQWNVLWKSHYETEFLKQYSFFVVSWKAVNINGECRNSFNRLWEYTGVLPGLP